MSVDSSESNAILSPILGHQSEITRPKFTLATLVLISISLVAIIKLVESVRKRYEKHKIFDKGNIPSVGNKNPFTGNLLDVIMRLKNPETLKQYHNKLGKTYGLFYGPDAWVITTDLELLNQIFFVDGHKHVDLLQLRLPLVKEFNKSVIQMRGNEWRQTRRALNPPFSMRQMKTDNVAQDVENICIKLLRCILATPPETTGGRIIDAQNVCQAVTIEAIFRVAYGEEDRINLMPSEKDVLVETIDLCSRNVISFMTLLAIVFDSLRSLMSRLVRFTKLGQGIKTIFSTIDECVASRKKMLAGGSLPSRRTVDTLLELCDSNKIDKATLKANFFMILLSGSETTANTLTVILWLLAKHPNVQEKLRQETRIEGEQSMYLEWCIRESLRLFPPVPITSRVITEDVSTSKGQTIFKGTNLIANIYCIQHDAEYWGHDVEHFRPERFGEPLANPLQYFAFGGGQRACLGRNLAMIEMRAVVTKIILNFHLEPCDSTPDKISWSMQNIIHSIIDGPINLRFVESTCL